MRLRNILYAYLVASLFSPTARAQGPALAALPLDFVENRGQWNGPIEFIAQKGPMTAAFERQAFTTHFGGKGAAVRLVFEGASPKSKITGEGRRGNHYNFYFGSDPQKWQPKTPGFTSILYGSLYDGIDMRIREETGRLEYDLLLGPAADLNQVVIRAEGAAAIDVSDDGALLLQTATGALRQSPPISWEVLPNGGRQFVEVRVRKIDTHRYGFVAAQRDLNFPLVIDPGLEWATYIGGSASEQLTAVAPARDGTGDLMVAGYMNSADFPGFSDPNFTPYQNRIFVARFNSTGTTLRWTTVLGGWHSQVLHRGLAAAPDGGAAIAGETVSPDFPTTPGAFDRTANFKDAFVTRLSASGTLVFSTFLGGNGSDVAYSVGFDQAGAVIAGGDTNSTDFPTTPGAFDTTYNMPNAPANGGAHGDVFITRLSLDGSTVTYSTFVGGPSLDALEDLAVDSQGIVTLVGWATGNSVQVFVTTPDAFDQTWNGSQDAIIARLKLNGAGAADLQYATLLGGSNQDNLYGVALDPLNPDLVTVAGMTWSDDFPVTAGVFKASNPRFSPLFPSQAAIVARFNLPAAGPRTRVWSTYYGPPGPSANNRATDVAVNSAGEPIVVGLAGDRNFPTTAGAFDRTPEGIDAGGGDFVARLSSNATQLRYGSFFGGTGGDTDSLFVSPQVAWLSANTVMIAGTTTSADFPVTAGAFDTTFGSPFYNADGFVSRFSADPDNSGDTFVGPPSPTSPPNGATFPSGTLLARLQWSDVADPSGIDGYQFELSTLSNFSSTRFGSVHGTEVIMPPTGTGEQGLATGTWFWRVRAFDRAGNISAWSSVSSFTIGSASAPPAVQFLYIYPAGVAGGSSAIGVIHLDEPAPAGGIDVTFALRYNQNTGYLAPNLPFPVIVPTTVTIPAGALSASFDIATMPVTQTVAVDVFTQIQGVGRVGILTVTPPSNPQTTNLIVRPATVTGGNPSTGIVTLQVPAPPGGTVVNLQTSHPQAARVPATVNVPAGATSAAFPITTQPVQFDIDSTVNASAGNGNAVQYVFVKQPGWPSLTSFTLSSSSVSGGTSVTGTVRFSGPIPFSTWPAFDDARVSVYASDPSIVGLASFVTVPSGSSSTTFTFIPRAVSATTTINLIAAYDSTTITVPLTVNGGPTGTLVSITFNVNSVSEGQGGIATARLSAPAPAGGVMVTFSSSDPAIYFNGQPAVWIPQGSTTASVPFLAGAVSSSTVVQISASLSSSNVSAPVTVTPGSSGLWVTSLAINPSTVNGGSSSSGVVTINKPAPAGGTPVQLFSSHTAASVPSTVTVVQGATSANFSIATTSVSSNTNVTITALLNVAFAAALTINSTAPPPVPAAPSLLSPPDSAQPVQPVTFDWTDVANAATYNIQIDTSSSFTTPLTVNQTVSVSQATIGGLPSQQVWWRVRGLNSAGVAGPFSASRRLTPQPAPPAPALSSLTLSPSSVVGGNTSQGTVTLTSAAPSGGLVVNLTSSNTAVASVPSTVTVPSGSTSSNFTVSTTAVTTSTSLTISGTHNSVTRSATLTVTPVSTGPLPAPSLIAPANDARFGPGTNITFDWTDVSGAASYTIQIDDSNSFPSPFIVNQNVPASTFSTSTLPTRTMWWRVRANNAGGNPGNWSSIRRFEVRD